MKKYNLKMSKIFRGLLCFLICGIILWFTLECFLVYTPFGNKLSFRDIGGYYIEGKVTELKTGADEYENIVLMIEAEYQVGFQKIKTFLPPHLWYYEGLKEGDAIAIPYHQKSFDDMSREEKNALYVLLAAAGVFLIRALILIVGELYNSHYFQGIVANKKYVFAKITDIKQRGKKTCAVFSFDGHCFKSKFYRIDEFPFKIGEEVRVYVDIDKNPEKYFVSEI